MITSLKVMAHKSSTKEILELRKTFDQYDSSNDGIISFEEFRLALETLDLSEDEVIGIFKSIVSPCITFRVHFNQSYQKKADLCTPTSWQDINENGHIQYTEFLAASLEASGYIEEERIAEAFDRLDADDSGYISKKNLRDFLGNKYTPAEVEKIISMGDLNGDGKISYSEFLKMFRQKTVDAKKQVLLQTESSSLSANKSDNLLGLDAKIPGGRYDSNIDDTLKKPHVPIVETER